MPPERVQNEINTIRCIGDRLFGAGNYDIVTRTGLVGAYGIVNEYPVLVMIRTIGDLHPVKTLREFKRIYQFIAPNTRIVIIRMERVRAISFMSELMKDGFKSVSSVIINDDDFKAISECRDDAVNKIINQIKVNLP